LQVILNKQEKERLVIKLYRQGNTIRQIASEAHISFTDIGKIIRKINGLQVEPIDIKSKSKDTQALYLFSIGKTPLEVAIELNLPSTDVHDLQEEFWALNQNYDLALVYGEIKKFLPLFLKLFHLLKEFGMLNEKYLSSFLKYAGVELPELTYKMQMIANEVIEIISSTLRRMLLRLQWKKPICTMGYSSWFDIDLIFKIIYYITKTQCPLELCEYNNYY
jgi:hypothetical protein